MNEVEMMDVPKRYLSKLGKEIIRLRAELLRLDGEKQDLQNRVEGLHQAGHDYRNLWKKLREAVLDFEGLPEEGDKVWEALAGDEQLCDINDNWLRSGHRQIMRWEIARELKAGRKEGYLESLKYFMESYFEV